MPFIIGTAGHIDHGKTSLVKALTGQDTDRLKEEKARGISIDLGFAYLDLPDGTRAGVIDVPGHERFIRNMLAGAHGVDLVLFTVAADDGVMPQTVEHLDILHLLGVSRAIFVVTKVDLVPDARVAAVEREIRELAAGTSLEGGRIVRVSSATEAGLAELRAAIADVASTLTAPVPSGGFRLPIDRVFALAGHGLVVTGTALQGDVKAGDRVRCLPGGDLFRVRSVQVHGEQVDAGRAGQRVAVNLSGTHQPEIARGHVLCAEELTMLSERFDAALEIRPSAPNAVRSHQRVKLHVGTAERQARLILIGSDGRLDPGGRGFGRIVPAEPLPVLRGDRFVIRGESGQWTIGGGIVLNPWPGRPDRRRLEASLEALRNADAGAAAELFIDDHAELAVPVSELQQFLNVGAADVPARLNGRPSIRRILLDESVVFTTERKWTALTAAIRDALGRLHGNDPAAPGKDMQELREQIAPRVPSKLFRVVIERLEQEGVVVRRGNLLSLAGHTSTLRDEDRRVADRIVALLDASPLAPPDVAQLEREAGLPRPRLLSLLHHLEREGAVVKVSADLFFRPGAVESVRQLLVSEFARLDDVTPAMFRDRVQTTRKYAIPLLEYFDRAGVTVRRGGTRRVQVQARART
ncbi:MAG: selenocysteine-specific translation elongation factor [Acidobacteria bacterium RIFCSPLOWO2_12_FULL_67_14]|nr:MAG: selenocysteine-specific translation elongation factor [Acidobacteria bacterium RIFCSPLOWO2_12_FULL_67_14]